jgi:hypothetical protein
MTKTKVKEVTPLEKELNRQRQLAQELKNTRALATKLEDALIKQMGRVEILTEQEKTNGTNKS